MCNELEDDWALSIARGLESWTRSESLESDMWFGELAGYDGGG